MLRLKLQYFGHLMWTAYSLEKSLMLEKLESRRKRGCQSMRWLDGITDAMYMNLGKLGEMVKDRKAWHSAVHEVAKSWTWLGDWTITTIIGIQKQRKISIIYYYIYYSMMDLHGYSKHITITIFKRIYTVLMQ